MVAAGLERTLDALPPDSQGRRVFLSASDSHAGACFSGFPVHRDMGISDDIFVNTGCMRMGVNPAWAHEMVGKKCVRCAAIVPPGALPHFLGQCSPLPEKDRRAKIGEKQLTAELRIGCSPVGINVTTASETEYIRFGYRPKEPASPTRSRDITRHKPDIVVTAAGAQTEVWDLTVGLPTLPPKKAPDRRGDAGRAMERSKQKNLDARFEPNPHAKYVPFVMETHGLLGKEAAEAITRTAKRAYPPRIGRDGKEHDLGGLMARFVTRLRARVQIALAEGNEEMFAEVRKLLVERSMRAADLIEGAGEGTT